MNPEELARYQQEESVPALYSFAMQCRRRFLRSADLVGMRGPVIENLRQLGVREPMELRLLIPAWRCLCERYLSERYDRQMTLFEDFYTHVQKDWECFVYHEVLPNLLLDDELVRNVLRAIGGLPSKSPEEAASMVHHYISELAFPGSPQPWDPEEGQG
ncbi:MAG: hypothetical protein KKB20_06370 [Proteobacteria bacterium]|nr:hypothetical protein [Pseudomonadota bacterium]